MPQHPFGVCLMTLTDDYQLQFSEFLSTNYRLALSNIDKLRSLGAKVMHDVDATKMAHVFPFNCMRFDRVVYNFPLAGFFPNESREDEIRLVDSFFEKLLQSNLCIACIPNSYMKIFLLYHC